MPPLVSNSSGRVVAIELHPSSSTGATAVPAPSSAPADGPLQGRQSGRLLLLGSRSSLSGGNGASAGALRHRNSTSRSGDAAAMPSPRQQQQQQQQDAEEDADSSTDSQQPASAAAASLARGTRPDPATEGAVMTKEEVGAVCVPCTCFWRPHPFLEAAAKVRVLSRWFGRCGRLGVGRSPAQQLRSGPGGLEWCCRARGSGDAVPPWAWACVASLRPCAG